MRIVDREYSRGLYCHAPSKLLVRLPGPAEVLTAIVGVDSNDQTSGGRGSVEFSVHVGGTEKFLSGVMREGMPGRAVKVELGGATEFVMQVDETPDGIACDQADWVEAKVALKDGRDVWLADLPLREELTNRLFSTDRRSRSATRHAVGGITEALETGLGRNRRRSQPRPHARATKSRTDPKTRKLAASR